MYKKYTPIIDKYTINVYYVKYDEEVVVVVKQRDLVKRFTNGGFKFVRHGGDHDIYRRGNDEEQIPRHREINETLAKALLRKWGL